MATSTYSNIGPLTTTFTPPAGCFEPNLYNLGLTIDTNDADSWSVYPYGRTCSIRTSTHDTVVTTSFDHQTDPRCWPSTMGSILNSLDNTANYNDFTTPFYAFSPGLICPSGWTEACSVSVDESRVTYGFATQYARWLKAEESMVVCCPGGLQFECESNLVYPLCTALSGGAVTGTYFDLISHSCSSTFTATITPYGSPTADFEAVALIRHNSDGPVPTSNSNEPGSGGSGAPVMPGGNQGGSNDSGNNQADGNESTGNESSGLTTGAKIGIGIGVPLGVAMLGLAGALLWWLRFKNMRQRRNIQAVPIDYIEKPNELDVNAVQVLSSPAEVAPHAPQPAWMTALEMDGASTNRYRNAAELPG